MHARVVTDDDVVIGGGDTRPGHFAYATWWLVVSVFCEREITGGCVVVPAGVGSERFRTDGRVEAAGGIVHERKVTGGSVGVTAVVKDERVGSNAGVVCAAGIEQQRCSAHRRIGIPVVERQRSAANTGVEAAGRIQKERTPTKPCISGACGEETKRIASFRCREIGIAPVWCRGWCWRGCRRRRGRGCRQRAGRAVELNPIEIRRPATNDRIVELKRVATRV